MNLARLLIYTIGVVISICEVIYCYRCSLTQQDNRAQWLAACALWIIVMFFIKNELQGVKVI